MDTWGKGYLCLCLQLNRHVPGYVDAYVGPEALRQAVLSEETRPPAALLEDVAQLEQDLPRQGYEAGRQAFLSKQLQAMETTIRKVAGEVIAYREEVERCFDISPRLVEEERFLAAHAELEELIPGQGPLRERLQAYRDRFIVAEDQVLPLAQVALEELRQRTQQLVSLPAGEEVQVTIVREQPWGAYNWYLGQSRSRIELNVDLPTRASGLLELFSHEAYPGHHTEASLKEQLLYRERGHAEAAIAPLLTPANVVAEGIANVGSRVIFEDAERCRWKNEVLYPQAGLEPVDAELALRIEEATRSLRHVSNNAALLLHEAGWPVEDVLDYLERYSLRSRKEVEHGLRFLQSPLFRAYTFCYAAGEELIEAAMARTGDRRGLFVRLLTEQWTPSGIAALQSEAPPL